MPHIGTTDAVFGFIRFRSRQKISLLYQFCGVEYPQGFAQQIGLTRAQLQKVKKEFISDVQVYFPSSRIVSAVPQCLQRQWIVESLLLLSFSDAIILL